MWCPSTISTHSAITHLHSIAPPRFVFNLADLVIHSPSCTSFVSTDDLVCHLCSSVVDHPIQLTCNRLVCMNCLCTSLRDRRFCCPCCNSDHLLDFNTMVQPSPVVMKVLGDLQVSCTKYKQQISAVIDSCNSHNLHALNKYHTIANHQQRGELQPQHFSFTH